MIRESALRGTAGSIPVVKTNNYYCHVWERILTASLGLLAIGVALLFGACPAYAAPSASDPFLLLLKGVYSPVRNAPSLGLAGINLNDGSFSVTNIYPVNTAPSFTGGGNAIAGRFYTQFEGSLAVYDLPGGPSPWCLRMLTTPYRSMTINADLHRTNV